MGLVGARDHQQPRRVTVEPVHDSGPLGLLPTLDLPAEKPMDEGPGAVTGGRVHDHAGRLVDDEEMLVLVRDAKIELLWLEFRGGAPGDVAPEPLPAHEPVALRAGAALDEDAALAEKPL